MPTRLTGMELRHDWSVPEAEALLNTAFHDLLFDAHTVHRERFEPHAVGWLTLLTVAGCSLRSINRPAGWWAPPRPQVPTSADGVTTRT